MSWFKLGVSKGKDVKYELKKQDAMRFCSKCLYPEIAVNLILDNQGLCSACHLQTQIDAQSDWNWDKRREKFLSIVDESKSRGNSDYDCIIPVSGGKDSYFQTHTALELGLNPILVTYHGNNYMPEGKRNLDRMREAFNVDHLVMGPGVETLREMNRVGFKALGDMNWHAHAGIKTFPMQMAVQLGIPLVVWGEITWSIAGMFDLDDYVTFNKRTVFEHDMRGVSVEEFCSHSKTLDPALLPWLRMPSDLEFEESGTVGVYIGNFFPWDPNSHTDLMTRLYGFEVSSQAFERTYRRMSNLDDMHENGVHDYMKFVKFGYGRATDHASKDIRSGHLSREQGLHYVQALDHVLPRKDLGRWLDYVRISEEEFHLIAERYRDPRVWWIEDGYWWKANAWGGSSQYGRVIGQV